MAKSDDAKRIRRMAELLLDNDPYEENEPREPGSAEATMTPHFNNYDDPRRQYWPGSEPDMRRRAPRNLGPSNRDLARALRHGNRRSV